MKSKNESQWRTTEASDKRLTSWTAWLSSRAAACFDKAEDCCDKAEDDAPKVRIRRRPKVGQETKEDDEGDEGGDTRLRSHAHHNEQDLIRKKEHDVKYRQVRDSWHFVNETKSEGDHLRGG